MPVFSLMKGRIVPCNKKELLRAPVFLRLLRRLFLQTFSSDISFCLHVPAFPGREDFLTQKTISTSQEALIAFVNRQRFTGLRKK
jgi:hypothetical protein